MTYIQNILSTIKTHNLLFLAITVFIFQLIAVFLKPYSINIYGPSAFLTIYSFLNTSFSIYQLIIGGILATSMSYFLYKAFIMISPKQNATLLNVVTFVTILTTMILFNCVSMPAVAYTLMSHVSIPQNTFSYLSSYIVSTIVILILCTLLLFIAKNTNNYIFQKDISNLQQLEKNMTI